MKNSRFARGQEQAEKTKDNGGSLTAQAKWFHLFGLTTQTDDNGVLTVRRGNKVVGTFDTGCAPEYVANPATN